ncbi:MAG: transporter substrate-binding domain-containing protein [Chloroflexi bacterium]|nr:MAG: transporter substrate-binding domain-containing protein [Chloroflexota bacterium]
MKKSVFAIVAALVLGACGGTSSNGPSSPSALGKVDRIANEVPSEMKGQTLQIATDATYEPNEFVDPTSGEITGWDIDFGLALCKVMGVDCKFQNVTFGTIITQLKATSSRYQFSLSSWSPTQDRENSGIDFISYYRAGESWIVKASGGATINSAADLCGKSVAVESGTTEESDAYTFMGQGVGGAKVAGKTDGCKTAGKADIKVLSFAKQTEANSALLSGRADAGWLDQPVAAYQVKKSSGQFKVSGQPCSVAPYGLAIVKGSKLEQSLTDATKYLIENGFYRQVLDKWGVTDGAITSSDVKLNDNNAVGAVCVQS